MDKIVVNYYSGESRYSTDVVDWMIANVDGIELYAEYENADDELGSFEPLKREIIEQANIFNIDVNRLDFD